MNADVTSGRAFLRAEWLDLVMLNYEVVPELLEPFVPAGTVLDHWDGQAIVSVVGFRFVGTRVLGVAVPGHEDFEEVNLRFYVRRNAPDGPRRGVVFIRELVPRRAIAWTARLWYNEPYRALPMRHEIVARDGGRTLSYEWRASGQWCGLGATTAGPSSRLEAGSEAEFVTEHYWGYTRQRDGGTVEYQVTHSSWRVWAAERAELRGDMVSTYGPKFAEVLVGPPRSAFVAEGSEVTVFRPRRLGPAEIRGGNG